ncbi:hypothetical protein EJB05_51727 [Eragrostis curvula]|uniref:MATH domain-containing protein n=1 Tax=Eragrostis curvula TaxID=38414 RepID=A0A5J9SBM7_9POAL|nr:hypothetical protein EJB05_58138 [Eragrostis curvula]TVU02758.1 hypothetical protein EJB05_51727 [Eragrostis curvula]
MMPGGTSVDSGNFHAGGRKWKLQFYSNGHQDSSRTSYSWEEKKEPSVSVKLSLAEKSQAMAAYKVSILSRSGMPVFSAAVEPYLYDRRGYRVEGSGHRDLVSVEELRRSADRVVDTDDCLNVLCEVSVLKLDSESVAMWILRHRDDSSNKVHLPSPMLFSR